MFKNFFKNICVCVANYVKKHGIIKTICHTIQGAIAATGIVSATVIAFKHLKTKLKIKWHLKKHSDRLEAMGIIPNNDTNGYDENGYKLTSTEYYDKNKQSFEMAKKYYTDDNLACVKLIEKNDPKFYEGLTMDQKIMYIVNNEITFEDLMYKYSLDKDSQVKRHIAEEEGIPVEKVTNEQLQKFWDESEKFKIGIGSKVEKGYQKPKSKKKQAKEKMIQFFTPADYAAMEEHYGVDKFHSMNPRKLDPVLLERRQRFDESVMYTSAQLNYLYVHKKKMLKQALKEHNNNPVELWAFMLNAAMTDDEVFEEAKKTFAGKMGLLESEAKGNRTSGRPAIKTLEQADYVDKLERILDNMNDIETKRKCNISPYAVIEDEDEEEDIFDEDDDNLDDIDDFSKCHFDDDSMLDQLDALRESAEKELNDPKNAGKTDAEILAEDTNDEVGYEPVNNPEEMIKKPVHLNHKEEEHHDIETDGVLYIEPDKYTTGARAIKLLDMYAQIHKEDADQADNFLLNMLNDSDHRNFDVFEHSLEMRKFRYEDRMHQLPFKLLKEDYDNKEELMSAAKQFQNAINIYGLDSWKDMIDQRMEWYYTYFEVDTADKMMIVLPKHPMPHKAKVDLIRMFIMNGYEDCVARADGVYDYYLEAKKVPEDRIKTVILDDNIDQYSYTELCED